MYSVQYILSFAFREEKLKLKKARNLQTKQEASAVKEDLDSEDDAEKSDVDLSWLPDPEKVFPPKDEGVEHYDRNELSLAGRGSDDSDGDTDDDGDNDADSFREEEEDSQM
jgi:hypothetical protein